MNEPRKLRSEQREHQQEEQELRQGTEQILEFDTVEKLLRHDAMHTPIPPRIGERLRDSIETAVVSKPSWWRRFLSS